jgi:hypothetical protein
MRYLSLILAVIMIAAVVGCDNGGIEPSKRLDVETWQCVHYTEISIAVIAREQDKVYCEVRVDAEAGAVLLYDDDLVSLLKDGHWQQVEDTKPLLDPPPPGWWNMGVSDRVDMGVRIDGSNETRGRVHKPLPVHDQIQVTNHAPRL